MAIRKIFLVFLILSLNALNCESFKVQENSFLYKNPQYKSYLEKAILHDFSDKRNKEILKKVATKWKSKKNLKIRIFGDSHIASDFIANEFRNLLGNINALGFTYPLQPISHQSLILNYEAKNFNILDVRMPLSQLKNLPNLEMLNFPLGGVIAYPKINEINEAAKSAKSSKNTESNSFIKLDINPKSNIKNDTFITQIIYKNDSKNPAFLVQDSKNSFILQTKEINKWEMQLLELNFPINITALSENAMLGGYFFYKNNDNNIVESIGLNGVRSDIWLKWDKEILKSELDILDYDIIILSYGSNNAMYDVFNEEKFIKNYADFIALLREYNKECVFILVAPPPVLKMEKKKYVETRNNKAVNAAVIKLARKEHTLLFNMSEFIESSAKDELDKELEKQEQNKAKNSKNTNSKSTKNTAKNAKNVPVGNKNAMQDSIKTTKDIWIKNNLSKKDVHLTPQGYYLTADALFYSLNQKFFDTK
ncbi:GDSL-type esterase/lipase family protein [Helicobacter saguini]|uniref:SGNH hydrolase-type esterase domain-containing protein n=1 Tax=Helicobacter saguini TaxID=1548018 RepID=A0A6L7DDH7_9HELI|nr:GDSL-type esterase/lipase family protein [Helicobacter saguini]MWV61730.1 hypothetical protein [Helicobacter saguini]MWV69949.1 hypothetical protein [Helicobacter saguini]MWV72837.1 hypothetical protein [Helicobacter saguini]